MSSGLSKGENKDKREDEDERSGMQPGGQESRCVQQITRWEGIVEDDMFLEIVLSERGAKRAT